MLLALYLLEAGLLLILAPWSRFWERNYFAGAWPWVATWATHAYVKGAVTGVGIVAVAAALVEIGDMLSRRSSSAGTGG